MKQTRAHKVRIPKRTSDGRAMLNIACGFVTHEEWNNLDFSPYAFLADRKSLAEGLNRVGLLSDKRFQRVQEIDPEMINWDLRKGLPFEENTFDVVYHSHFITQVSPEAGQFITQECYRTLKPGGTHRIVTDDFEQLVHLYNEAIAALEQGNKEGLAKHEQAMHYLLDLFVHKEPVGTKQQKPIVRFLERLLRNPESTGERRKWFYDQYSMGAMMRKVGFEEITSVGPRESRIEGWNNFGIDLNPDGTVYKERSFWMEGVKPT